MIPRTPERRERAPVIVRRARWRRGGRVAAIGLGFALALAAMATTPAAAAAPPYPADADAHADLARALDAARSGHKLVLIVFGANWCADCHDVDRALAGEQGAEIAARYVVVKVDVGNFDRNLDIARRYGDPIRAGIPAAAVVSADDRLLYATRAGELSHAHRLGAEGIARLLSSRVPAAP